MENSDTILKKEKKKKKNFARGGGVFCQYINYVWQFI